MEITDRTTNWLIWWRKLPVTVPEQRVDFPARAQRIKALRASGMTLEAIGREFGLSRERIRQILKRN